MTYTSQNSYKINQTMPLYIVQYPGQNKLVMIIFKSRLCSKENCREPSALIL